MSRPMLNGGASPTLPYTLLVVLLLRSLAVHRHSTGLQENDVRERPGREWLEWEEAKLVGWKR